MNRYFLAFLLPLVFGLFRNTGYASEIPSCPKDIEQECDRLSRHLKDEYLNGVKSAAGNIIEKLDPSVSSDRTKAFIKAVNELERLPPFPDFEKSRLIDKEVWGVYDKTRKWIQNNWDQCPKSLYYECLVIVNSFDVGIEINKDASGSYSLIGKQTIKLLYQLLDPYHKLIIESPDETLKIKKSLDAVAKLNNEVEAMEREVSAAKKNVMKAAGELLPALLKN